MQDGRDVIIEIAVDESFQEFILVEVIGNLAIDEVAELVGAREVVDGEDVGLAAIVQRPDKIGADKARGAGDDDIHGRSQVTVTACCRVALIVPGRSVRRW